MAYTAPASNAVNFTWAGASPYVAPAPIDFSFDPTRFSASGFKSTAFGTAGIVFNAQGWATTQFGTANVVVFVNAASSAPLTAFGTPRDSRYFAHTAADPATAFGVAAATWPFIGTADPTGPATQVPTPTGTQIWRAKAVWPSTQIPTAFFAFTQEETPMWVVSTAFGVPVSQTEVVTPGNTDTYASSLNPGTQFGTPSYGPVFAAAASVNTTALGAPVARLSQLASGSLYGTFGAGTARLSQRASGAAVSAFGTPAVAQAFGSTGAVRTVFGTPRAAARTTAQATGAVTTALGLPVATITARARALSPTSVFGKPAAQRELVC